jgi:hypothetical protein
MQMALFILCFIIIIFIGYSVSDLKSNKIKQNDNLMIQNYQLKPFYKKKVVLVIENFDNLNCLLTLIRYVLHQTVKVNSIILISELSLHHHDLIYNTCVVNKLGGLSILLKESSKDTIILYVFPEALKGFYDPNFLKEILETQIRIKGIVKVETNKVKVDISKVYTTSFS